MNQAAKLLVNILSKHGRIWEVEGEVIDNTKFTIKVNETLVEEIENNRGWLSIIYHGQRSKEKSVYVTLPSPSLQYGQKITVHSKYVNK